MEQVRKILITSVFILSASLLFRTIFLLWNSFLPDFSTRYDSAVLLFHKVNPYLSFKSFTPENYSPSFLLLLYPLIQLPFTLASKIWLLIITSCFFLSLFVLYKIKPISSFKLAIITFFAIVSFPFKFTLGMGQTNLILLLLICLFTYEIIKGKYLLAGIFLSLSIAIKLIPLLFVPYLFINRNIKTLTFSLLSLLVFLLIPFFLLRRDINIYYFNQVFLPLIKNPAGGVYYNQSITGFFSRLSLDANLLNITRIVIVCFSLWTIFKKKMGYFSAISLLIIVILLVNNFAWQHHLILLIVPFYFLITRKKYLQSLISYSFVFFNIKNAAIYSQNLLGNIFLSHGFIGTLILWLIFVWNLKKSEVK